MHQRYIIVGGGLSAASAIEGIRAHDPDGGILLFSRENHLPYQRNALTKDAWAADYDLEQLSVHPDAFYAEHGVELRLRREVVEIEPEHRLLWDDRGESAGFDHLLLATGCRPRRLEVEGSELSSVRYFRDLEDYLDLTRRFDHFQHATIVGGGFTAVELAATLRGLGKEITLVLPEEYPLHRVLPRELGLALADDLRELQIETVSGETLSQIVEAGGFVHARTLAGNDITTQLVLVDLGAEAQVELAEAAGLDTDDGIVVDEYGHTSRTGIWATGDVAEFPYLALNQLMRVEGSDHAQRHGRVVGANMAGASQVYDHLPLKWFRVGGRQFEGVGELNARLQTELHWLEPGRRAVVLYVRDEAVRGVLLCDIPDRVDWARQVLREGRPSSAVDCGELATVRS